MRYEGFCAILNRHIFEGEKKELLRRLAENPERFIGLFRPTKPEGKILQYLLQSHEIRMGDALEEIIGEILKDMGFSLLPKRIKVEGTDEELYLDHYFTDGKTYYFIEQKVRDDHDSTKKRGQISNFERKLEVLSKRHKLLVGIMYFLDPDFSKNKNFYMDELRKMEKFYDVKLKLCYGGELFTFFNKPEIWGRILSWLQSWKNSLPELPETNLDATPEESFEEVKDLELRTWRLLIVNDRLWEEGIMQGLFRKGAVLKLLLNFFRSQKGAPYENLARSLENRLREYFSLE